MSYYAFNELSRKAMLWTVQHIWPAGAQFAFNCYRHSATLIVRQKGKDALIIYSKEGVTHGDVLASLLYGLSMSPLSKELQEEIPALVQPWFANDSASGAS